MLLALSPFLSIRFASEGIILENYLTHRDYLLAADKPCELIAFLSVPREREILEASAELSADDLEALLSEGIVVATGGEHEALAAVQAAWAQSGWAAPFYFNWATRDYPFIDYSDPAALDLDREIMRGYSKESARPSNGKTYPTHSLPLAPVGRAPSGTLEAALSLMHYNQAGRRAPSLEDLSRILFCTSGKIGRKPWPEQGEFLRRTTPSGGARHPTETYLVNVGVPELPQGAYHYNVEAHGLDPIETSSPWPEAREQFFRAVPDMQDRAMINGHAILVFSSFVERSMWRYRDSRSYRVILIDVGHVLMNFRSCCEALGLGYFCGQGFSDSSLSSLLALDQDAEPPMMIGII